MKFIHPNEISGKIMTLIEESDEFVLLVSPYIKIQKWYKFLNKIDAALEKGIKVNFIIRKDKTNVSSVDELEQLKYNYIANKNLHAKLYINESYAIVTSMNLLLSSEINSTEIGYKTETKEEYQELSEYINRYLYFQLGEVKKVRKEVAVKTKIEPATQNETYDTQWIDFTKRKIEEGLGNSIRVYDDGEALKINTGTNNYDIFIWNSTKNVLRIAGILSGKEFVKASTQIEFFQDEIGMKIEVNKGVQGYNDQIWGTLERNLISQSIVEVITKEQQVLMNYISRFVITVDNFKRA